MATHPDIFDGLIFFVDFINEQPIWLEVTRSMQVALDETTRRRKIQAEYNARHGITPETIKKRIYDLDLQIAGADYPELSHVAEEEAHYAMEGGMEALIERLEQEMKAAAKALEFERAAHVPVWGEGRSFSASLRYRFRIGVVNLALPN